MTVAIPLQMAGQTGLSTTLMEGEVQPVVTPPMQVEVAVAMRHGSQLGTTTTSPEASARPMPLVAQAMAPGMGRMEGDAAKGSFYFMVLGEGSVSVPLIPSIA